MEMTNQSSQPEHSKSHSSDIQTPKEKKSSEPPLFNKIDSDDFRELYDVQKLLLGAQRHVLLILICMVAFGMGGAYLTYIFQTTYEAESVVLYQKEQAESKNIEGGFTITNLSLPTVLDLIKLPAHFEAVKTNLGLDLDPKALDSMVDVPIPKNESNLVRIVVKANNPNLAVDIANSLAKVAVKSSQDFTRRQYQMALNGYEAQLGILRRKLSGQIKRIEDFKIANQYFDMTPEESTFLAKVEEARKERNKAEIDYNSQLVEYENLKKEAENLPNYVPMTMGSTNSPLQIRIMSLQAALAEARAKYTKDNPKLLSLENELSDLLHRSKSDHSGEGDEKFYQKNEMKDKIDLELLHLQSKVRSAEKVKEEVSARVKELEAELAKLPVQQMALVKLLQTKDVTQDQLKEMNKAVELARLMVNSPQGSIELYQLASEAKPWKQGLFVDLIPIICLLLGMGLGFVIAIFLEVNDSKIRTAKQIEMYYSVPCCVTIPELSGLNKTTAENKMLFFIRNLVDFIDKTRQKKHLKNSVIINLTSSLSYEGKSLIATLTANYYAKLDHRVLLLEMDKRENPFAFAANPSASIADHLLGKSTLDEAIVHGKYDYMTIGKREPAMKELLKGKQAQALWRHLRSKYEIIIIDSPGTIEEDYAVNLAEVSDLSLLVVGSSHVAKSTVDEALAVLDASHARPVGILLNRVDKAYISDKRILLDIKKTRGGILKELLFWRS